MAVRSTHYCGFKLATCTYVLSILDIDLYSNIQQALHFCYIIALVLSRKVFHRHNSLPSSAKEKLENSLKTKT